MTEALGYRFVFDRQADRFAHPAVRYVLAADGRLSRVLPAFGSDAATLRTAIEEAGEGGRATVFQQIATLCYGYDAVTGRYTLVIERLMMVLAALTALGLGGAIMVALRRERREGGA